MTGFSGGSARGHAAADDPIDVTAAIPVGPDGPGRLLDEMRRAGIGRALARADAALRSPVTGNPQALAACADAHDRLAPIAVVAPTRSGDPAASIERLERDGAIGFWLGSAPWRGSPGIRSEATDRLLAAIARTGRPLLVPLRAWGDATAIGERTAGLGIAVVLVGAHYDTIVDDIAAAERHEHLHLETSRLAHLRAVERTAAAIGHERLLFGSGLPARPPSAPRNAVVSAGLSEDAKRAILGGNAARLFGLPAPAIGLPAPIVAVDAIDVHGHLPPTPWDVPDVSPPELLGLLATSGIARVAVSSVQAVLGDVEAGNAATVAACAADERLLGYLVADAGDLAATRAQLRLWGDARGIVGVKVHCQWSERPTASPDVARLFELLAEHGRPVKIHVDGDGWQTAIGELAARHPRLPIVAAHAGPGAPDRAMARAAAGTENLHLELASSAADLETVRDVARIAGHARMLFGTDAPLLEPAFALGTYADAGIGPPEAGAIYRENAMSVLGLGPPAAPVGAKPIVGASA